MKYGINAFLWTAAFQEKNLPLIPKVKAMGFDGIELTAFDFSTFPAAKIRQELAANQLEATFCTALTGTQNIGSDDAAIRNSTIEFLKVGIQAAAEAGAQTIAGPFCSAVGWLPGRRRTEDEWKRAVEGLASLGPLLASCNIDMAIEPLNRFETFFLNTAADAVKLCDEINHPRIGILFDTFHSNIEEKSISDGYRTVARHLKHVHTCENDRGTPGSGHVDWKGVFQALKDINYNGWQVIETFGPSIPEIAAAACIWRDLAPTAESIATDGLKFLKESQA